MANSKYQKKKIQETENSGFGQYDEGVGGGASPNDSKQGTHGHGANSDYRKENNDTMQARTADGKFTYKSVNGQSIDPKYGPSRGKTVNPLLTGGKNGIKINDVESQFSAQKGDYWDKYKDSWYTKGGEYVLGNKGKDWKVHVSGQAIWDLAKEIYNEVTGEFGGDIDVYHGSKHLQGYGGKEESHNFDEVKKGSHSLDEKAALQKAKKTKEEQPVINSNTGGTKVKPGTQLPTHPVAPTPTPAQPTAPTPIAPSTPTQQPQPQAESQPVQGESQPVQAVSKQTGIKYGEEEVNKVKDFFKNKFGEDQAKLEQLISKIEALSPEQLDKQIDMWTSKGVDFGFEKKEEDSDSIKKIKDLGFNG